MTPLRNIRLVFANGTTARYPHGGGHWSVRLQYMFGMSALGVDWFWLELLTTTGNPAVDQQKVSIFLRRMRHYGFGDRTAVLLFANPNQIRDLKAANIFGIEPEKVAGLIRDADLLWNFCLSMKAPLLEGFKRPVLLDLDPGHIHVGSLTAKMGIDKHAVHFTVGSKLADADTAVPLFGVRWIPFWPVIYLPMWKIMPDPSETAPFTSVTQWTWGRGLSLQGKLISTSKRDAYLRYLELPRKITQPLELAANLHPEDRTGDRELLLSHGWKLAEPHAIAKTPALYRRFIGRSRGELSCPKPVFRELKTGWFSDRSAAYLASGRPVLAEDTGFSDHLPTGRGLLTFSNMEEAVEGFQEINRAYACHMRAARELAEEYFNSEKVLRNMLDQC